MTQCILAETGLSVHNGGHVSICNGSRQMFAINNQTITLDQYTLLDAWHSDTRQEIKQALAKGIQHENCVDCWTKEAAGFPSMRQIHNKNLQTLSPKIDQPTVLILKPGNVCNLGCRHCDARVSSGWYIDDYSINFDYQSYKEYLDKFKVTRASFSDDNINWEIIKKWSKNIMHWDLYGAEPLLVKPVLEALQSAVDNNSASNQTVHINTNGTIWRDEFADLFTKFKTVNLDISVDGIEDKFNYLRYPAKFDDVLTNILKYKELSISCSTIVVSVTVTVSIYNVLDLNTILNYFNNLKINCSFNLLHDPAYFNIRALPEPVKFQVKNYLLKKFNHPLKRPIMEFIELPLEDPNVIKEFFKTTSVVDTQRNQSFASTFPEMYQLIKNHE